MQKIYTTADYEVKQGRFLIFSTSSGDKYTEVAADVLDGTDEAYQIAVKLQESGNSLNDGDTYWIHEGFVIANSRDSHDCAATLFVISREEATESLARFLADLNAY